MLELDSRTLLVVTSLISIGSAVALTALWRAQLKSNGVGFWAIGMSCVALASILISMRGVISDVLSLVLANSLYVLGFLLILRGIRKFTERARLLLFDIGILPIAAFSFYYFNYIDPSLAIRIAVLSAAFVIICSAIIITLLPQKDEPWRNAAYAVMLVFALFALIHGARGFLALYKPIELTFMQSSAYSSIVFLSGIFIIGGIAITLILLTYSVLESQLRITSQAVEQSASSIMITDRAGIISYVNPAAIAKTGYLKEELIGQTPRILRSGEAPIEQMASLWQSISAGKPWKGEFHNRKKSGEFFWEIASIAPVKQRGGKISHFVAVKEDITGLKEAKARIQHLADHDMLTGLATRKLFMQNLVVEIAKAKENSTKVAVLFIDLDGFKSVNDSYGHNLGDQLLKHTAKRLSACLRDTDQVARIGGDEFLVLHTNFRDNKSIATATQRIGEAISTPFDIDGIQVNITASIGISVYPDHGDDMEEMVKRADQAMYKVKRQGKNNYVFA